jgi:formate hydrogenlyase transcriptional activator
MNIPDKGLKKERLEKARAKKPTGDRARRNKQLVVSEGNLEERLKFETLLADISARFVNLPADQIDREIENAQRLVCEFLGLDLSALWQRSVEPSRSFILTHLYRSVEGPPPPERMDAHEFFPWNLQQVMAGKVIAISSLEELPVEASRDREVLCYYGIKTTLNIPLSAGGEPPLGVVSFNTMLAERAWPDKIVKRLQLVAQVFANALARKRADQALQESEARLSLAADVAGAGLWILNVDTDDLWGTEQTRELFGLAPGGEVTFQDYLNVIYPEDRERVRLTVKEAMQFCEDKRLDYRIMLPDGTVRWISSRGRPHFETLWGTNCLMGVSIDITERKLMEEQLKERLREIEDLKERLERENIFLQEEVKSFVDHTEIVGQSQSLKRVLAQAEQVARTDSTVMLLGETGTGKELLARDIHRMSARKNLPLLTVNCASLPPTLIESELFGREKGAYTGALSRMIGRFETAHESTLFLDEIGELPLELQSKLLRVLEEGQFERLGSSKTVQVNIRLIVASNRDLDQDVKEGKFRKDLYYRLSVFPIHIPPLRERPEDIPLLVWAFVRQFAKKLGKRVDTIPRKSLEVMQQYQWPGNVRELKNFIERAMIQSSGRTLAIHFSSLDPPKLTETPTLADMERRHILDVLEKNGWRITGRGGAAEILGLKRTTLQFKMKKLGIKRPTT